MILEIIVGIIAVTLIITAIIFIIISHKLARVIKKTDHVLSGANHLMRSLSDPTSELIHNSNKLVLDVKKKSESLDVIFRPLYGFKKVKSGHHDGLEKVGEILCCITEGIQLFSKIKKELK